MQTVKMLMLTIMIVISATGVNARGHKSSGRHHGHHTRLTSLKEQKPGQYRLETGKKK